MSTTAVPFTWRRTNFGHPPDDATWPQFKGGTIRRSGTGYWPHQFEGWCCYYSSNTYRVRILFPRIFLRGLLSGETIFAPSRPWFPRQGCPH